MVVKVGSRSLFLAVFVIAACAAFQPIGANAQGRGHGPGPGSRGPSYHAPAPRPSYNPRPAPRVASAPPPVPGPSLSRAIRYLLEPPRGYVTITVGEATYYRYGYTYYRPIWQDGRWIYVEVAPPWGVTVTALPPSTDRVIINGQVYYREGSTYYVEKAPVEVIQTPAPVAAATSTATSPTVSTTVTAQAPVPATTAPQYVVAKPPVGALVETLPQEVTTIEAKGTTYFHSEGVYYLPIRIGEKTQYVIVEKPQ